MAVQWIGLTNSGVAISVHSEYIQMYQQNNLDRPDLLFFEFLSSSSWLAIQSGCGVV